MIDAYGDKREQINKRFNEIFRMINYVKKLNEELYKIRSVKNKLRFSYLRNEIDEEIYNRELNTIKKKEVKLESDILILLGRIKESIKLLVTEVYKGDLGKTEERKKALNAIKEAINNINVAYYPKYEKEMLEIEKELGRVEELELDRKIKPIIEEFEKKEEKKEEIIIPKKKISLKHPSREIRINFFDFLVKLSDTIFGNFSNELLDKFPNLYYTLRIYIKKTGLKLTPKLFLSFLLFSSTIIFVFGLVISLFILKAWAFLFSAILVILAISLTLLYFEYLKNSRKASIDNNLPFATIHMLSLLQTGISLEKVFYLLSDIKEYGYLSEEFGRIANLLSLGVSLTDSIVHVRDTTVSERFSEFLDELLLTLKSGRDVKEFLITYSEMQLALYRSDLEKLNQAMKTFSDLYVGIVLTVPMIFISIAIMLSTIAGNIFGMSISQFLSLITLILVPLINIGFLIFISRLEI